jgi:ligand-binding sensor domain-containing protein/two-component sensor histidine kinase
MKHFILLLLLFCTISLSAQDYHFKQISLAEGLSQSSINAIAQDANGFLWLGTQDGLNRFDGNNFMIFKNIPFDSSSLSENFITALSIDNQNQLWVGTQNEGVHLFHPNDGTFSRFYHNPIDNQSLSSNNITTIHTDKKGNIWIGTSNGLNLIEIKNKRISFKRFQYNSSLVRSFPDLNYIKDILVDSKNNLWLGTSKGLFKYQIETKNKETNLTKKQHWLANKNTKNGLTNNVIRAVEEDALGRIWIGTGKALHLFENGTFQTIPLFDNKKNETVNDLHVDKKGQLFIGTYDGIFSLKYENKTYQKPVLYEHLTNGVNSLHDNMVLNIFEDNHHEGLYWLGTYLSGIGQMYERKKPFVTNYLKSPKIGQKIGASVHLITKKGDELWLNTTSGLLCFNRKTDVYQLIEKMPIIGRKEDFYANQISTIYKDSSGQIWLGSAIGLLKLIQQNKTYAVQLFQTKKEEERGVFGIYENNKKLYLGGWSGINSFDLTTEKLSENPIVIDTVGSRQFGYQIRYFLKGKNNDWWIGSTHGIVHFTNISTDFWQHLQTKKGKVYTHNPNDQKSLISGRITALCKDKNGGIWIGTNSALVKVINQKNRIEFQSYGEKEGLANNLVYTIINDKNDLWLSTNRGLSRFDIEHSTFANFDIKDGLQSNEFNGKAYFQAEDGELFFGGINGYTSFYPSKIEMESKAPNVLLTQLETSNQSYNLLNEKLIGLKYVQNSFSVQFIGLDLLYPTDVEYFYQLKGGDDGRLVSLGNSRRVNFTQLGAGTYTLRVLAKNRDGAMNKVGDTVKIIIEAPFWQSWWFLFANLCLISFLIWAIYHIRYLGKMQKLAEIERVRKNAAQDFHDELGSKLTVISMFTELTKSKLNGHYHEVAPYLDKVSDTAGSLYHSMKDLLWALNPEQDTVQDLFLQLKDFGEELFDQTGVEFKSQGINTPLQDKVIPMEYKRHILLIFKELMNNSLRHSDCTSVCLTINEDGQKFKIILEDNGVGFNSSDEYDGDGLKNIYNRANKISGKINVCSNNRGTSVTLSVSSVAENLA